MTSDTARRLAEEQYPEWRGSLRYDMGRVMSNREAFLAGGDAAIEHAAQLVEDVRRRVPPRIYPGESSVADPPTRDVSDIAAAIRAERSDR